MKSIEVKGDKHLLKILQELNSKVAKQVNRRAVNLATTPILQAVKQNVPVDKGDLKKAQTKKITSKGGQANGIVGADADYVSEDGSRPAHYDHIIEYGHIAQDGKHVPANPYMRTAWDSSIEQAREIHEKALQEGIDQATK
jgi:HK97 gp10 family phage protein